MNPLFCIDAPTPDSDQALYAPVILTVAGWFVDNQLRGARHIRIHLDSSPVTWDRMDRPDVVSAFKDTPLPRSDVGFSARLPLAAGQHRLSIEAETLSGEIIPLQTRDITVKTWPTRPTGFRGWLDTLRQTLRWALPPDRDDTVLVLIPVKPGTPTATVDHARMLAERALQRLPARSSIVFDERGKAASRDEHPWRIAALAAIRQGMIERHLRDERWVFWADLDLADYPADLISTLIRRAAGGIAAPMVFMDNSTSTKGGLRFYDLAGFVEQGRWASPQPPYFSQPGPIYNLDSVGCCYLVPADLYRRGARHEEDPGSRHWIEKHGESITATASRNWEDLAYTDHYSVCAFARKNGLPVRAFADLIAFHEHVSD